MKLIEKDILIGAEKLVLTNQRALFWPRKKALILSDIHLGKPAHFRKNGIAIPTNVAIGDLNRLESLLGHYQPEQLIIVGDLIHAGANTEVQLLTKLLDNYPDLAVILIKGNHDRVPEEKLAALGIREWHKELVIDPFIFAHQKRISSGNVLISGHIHPGVTLSLPTKRLMKFPCFVVTETEIILPAFSQFTGLDTKNIPESAVCFAFYEEGIFEVI